MQILRSSSKKASIIKLNTSCVAEPVAPIDISEIKEVNNSKSGLYV